MSALMLLSLVIPMDLLAPLLVPMEGLLEWGTLKNGEVQALLRGISITIAIIFVIWQGIASKGSIARILISALAAGLLVWVVFNVQTLLGMVDDEISAGPVTVQVAPHGPTTGPA